MGRLRFRSLSVHLWNVGLGLEDCVWGSGIGVFKKCVESKARRMSSSPRSSAMPTARSRSVTHLPSATE